MLCRKGGLGRGWTEKGGREARGKALAGAQRGDDSGNNRSREKCRSSRLAQSPQPLGDTTLFSSPTVSLINSFCTKVILKLSHCLKTSELFFSPNQPPYFLLHKEHRSHQRKHSHLPEGELTNLSTSASILFLSAVTRGQSLLLLWPLPLAGLWSLPHSTRLSQAIVC